jgi:hypothetical protein
LNYKKPRDIEDMIVKEIEGKMRNLPISLQSLEIRKITKVHIRNPPPQLRFEVASYK